ncbi:ABC-F family ATP-binding cassette domain-containing protein [Candidatus Saccharibacteria bacterium]|nr:ABC-F family ATP-binding cassette domain-containing protein [Candidatus Saccharibacteria bacterium]
MKAEHLSLHFGATPLYNDCSFHFEDTDKVGVVGVNGSGKSTLFKIILGIEKLDEGNIELPGMRLGYLPQEIKINKSHDETTVWQYIAAARPVDELQEQLNGEYEKLAKYPESQAIMNRIMKLQDLIDSYDVANFDYELLKIVEKMNLQSLIDMPMKNLSGGQKSKVAFARVLFENAGLLLLDEPTNHLDVETKEFVANYLRNYRGMVLVISHDVEFLDTVTNKTLFLNKTTHKMKAYNGNYTTFRRQYAEEKAEQDRRITEQEREIKRIQEFVERARNAKRSNTALIRQGHVREKMLDRKMAELEVREQEYQRVALNVSPNKQSGKTPLEVQNLTFHYDDKAPLFEKLSFMLTRGEKFLIVGENGIGKSTLLKLIVGELKPDEGSIIFSQNTTVAYYAQELEILNEKETILDNVKSYDYTDTEMRSMLANFLFHGDDINKKVSVLSPGEKARVALCKILSKRANLIILDEPTNHFDPETQKVIGENFRDYDGTIVMVSHNPSFVEQVGITRMLVLPSHEPNKPALGIVKNYSREQLEYYYYLNSDLV